MENRRKSSLIHISSIVNNKLGKKPLYIIIKSWHKIVGSILFKVAVPVKIKQNILFISVTTHPWLQELTLNKHKLLGKIKEIVPEITDLHLILKSSDFKITRKTKNQS